MVYETKRLMLEQSFTKISRSLLDLAKLAAVKENLFWIFRALSNEDQIQTQKKIHEEWGLPKTTVNTLVKECQREGWVILSPIEGKRRDLQIEWTEAGRAYAQQVLDFSHQVEERAFEASLKRMPDLVEAFQIFAEELEHSLQVYQQEMKEGKHE